MTYDVANRMRQWVLSLLAIVVVFIGSGGFVAYGQENNNDIEVARGNNYKGAANSTAKAPGEQKAKEQDLSKGADSLGQRLTQLTRDVDSLRGQLEHLTSAAKAVKKGDIPWYQSMWLVIVHIVLTVLVAIIAVLAMFGPKSDKSERQSDIERAIKKSEKATQEPEVSRLEREIAQLRKEVGTLYRIIKEQADKIRDLQGSLNERNDAQPPAPALSDTPVPVFAPVVETKVEYIDRLPNKDASFKLEASQPQHKCYFVVYNGEELHLRERLGEDEMKRLNASEGSGLYRIEGQGPILREKEAGTVVRQEDGQYKVDKLLVLEAYDKN